MSVELADYAVTADQSQGRKFHTPKHPYRSDFQRDRDRIIHSQAFRRLEGKTQVFMVGTNDNYRNRLTHSIEVAQIGRTIATALDLNESLTEAICLGHDLGHSPFGHSGESVLNDLMAEYGGFEHNKQALRLVDLLEHPYPDFAGLNLMYETRLALAKHSSPYDRPQDSADFPEKCCSLEGQIANIADRIAYNCHDLEDGLRSQIIDKAQLVGVELFDQAQELINAPAIEVRVVRKIRTAKAVIDKLVSNCIETSRTVIKQAGVVSVKDVYESDRHLICISPDTDLKLKELESFLMEQMYLSDGLKETAKKVRTWLTELFTRLCDDPQPMPSYYRGFIETQGLQRTVCDYIAGMTDRYCLTMLDNA